MPQINFKNTLLNVPDTIAGKPFLEATNAERLDFLNLVEQKNPGIFDQEQEIDYSYDAGEDQDVGMGEGLVNALGRGINHLTTGLAINAERAGIISPETAAEQVAQDAEDMAQYPMSESVGSGLEEIQKAEGFGDSALAIIQNPGAVVDVAVQSLASSIPSIAGMIGGGLAGFAVGGPIGAAIGAVSGSGLGSYGVEWGSTVAQEMRKEGIDLDSYDEVKNFLNDEAKMKKAGAFAESRAIPIAVFDGITAGVAGRLVKPVSKIVAGSALSESAEIAAKEAGRKARQKVIDNASFLMKRGKTDDQIAKIAARAEVKASDTVRRKSLGRLAVGVGVGAELGVQAVGGGAGEASAQVVSEGAITSPGEVLLEMFAELPSGAVETGVGVMSNQRNMAKLKKAKILDENVINNSSVELDKADANAPVGAAIMQSIPNYTGGANAILYGDVDNNIVGGFEQNAINLINANLNNFESDTDTVSVQDNEDGTFDLVASFGKLTNLKFNNKDVAEKTALNINENLTTSLKDKERNYDYITARNELIEEEVKAKAKADGKTKNFNLIKSFNEFDPRLISEKEIQERMELLKPLVTLTEFEKARKIVIAEKKYDRNILRVKMKEQGIELTNKQSTQIQKMLRLQGVLKQTGNFVYATFDPRGQKQLTVSRDAEGLIAAQKENKSITIDEDAKKIMEEAVKKAAEEATAKADAENVAGVSQTTLGGTDGESGKNSNRPKETVYFDDDSPSLDISSLPEKSRKKYLNTQEIYRALPGGMRVGVLTELRKAAKTTEEKNTFKIEIDEILAQQNEVRDKEVRDKKNKAADAAKKTADSLDAQYKAILDNSILEEKVNKLGPEDKVYSSENIKSKLDKSFSQKAIDIANSKLFYHEEFLSKFSETFLPRLIENFKTITSTSETSDKDFDVAINFVRSIEGTDSSKPTALLREQEGKIIIDIAAGALGTTNTKKQEQIIAEIIQEEGFHVITDLAEREMGPLSKGDIVSLRKFVRKATDPQDKSKTYYDVAKEKYKNNDRYQSSGKLNEKLIEDEAMAAAYVQYIADGSISSAKEEMLYGKIKLFMRSILDALKNTKVKNIFQRISDVTDVDGGIEASTLRRNKKVAVDKLINLSNTKEGVVFSKEEINSIKNPIEKEIQEKINGGKISQEAGEAALNILKDYNPNSRVSIRKLFDETKKIINERNSVVNSETSRFIKNAKKKFGIGKNNSTETVGSTILDRVYGNTWNKKIAEIGLRFREAFINDLDYASRLDKVVASAEGDRMADVSSHAALQMAKNAAAILSGALNIGVPNYLSSSQRGKGFISNQPFTETKDGKEYNIGGLIDTVLNDVIENGTEEDFQLYMVAQRELEIHNSNETQRLNVMSADEAQSYINEYNNTHPYFGETAIKLNMYFNKLADFQVNAGVLSNSKREEYKQSLFYIPMYREVSNKSNKTFNPTIDEPVNILSDSIELGSQPSSYKAPSGKRKLKAGAGKVYRIYFSNGDVSSSFFRNMAEVEAYIKELKGSGNFDVKEMSLVETGQPVSNIFNNLIINMSEAIEASARNIATQRVVRDALKLNTITRTSEDVIEGVAGATRKKKGDQGNTVSVYVNGEENKFIMHDPMLFQMLTSLDDPSVLGDGFLSKLGTLPANALRELVTKDPGFMLANFFRDSLSAYVTSGRTNAPLVDSIKGLASAVGNNSSAEALRRAGIKGGFDWSKSGDSDAIKEVEKIINKTFPGRKKSTLKTVSSPLRYLWEKLDKGTENSDLATRIAVYNDVYARTGNEAQAIWEAQEVLNFRRRGKYMKAVTAIIPFLNARIQGLDILFRGFTGDAASSNAELTRERVKKLAFFRASYLIGFTSLLWFMQYDDDEWELIEDSKRDNNWIILGKYFGRPDSFISLPIPFEIGLLTKTIPDRILSYYLGTDTSADLKRSFGSALFGTLGVGFPTTIQPILETMTNYNFLTGRKILSDYEQNLDPSTVVRPSTSELAQKVASLTGYTLTPVEVDNIIRGYSGTLGFHVVRMIDTVLPDDITKPSRRIEEYPFVSRVFNNLSGAKGVTGEIYQLNNSLTKITRAVRDNEHMGNYDRANQIEEDNIDILSFESEIRRSVRNLQKINKKLKLLSLSKGDYSQEFVDEERKNLEFARRLEGQRVKFIKEQLKARK